VAPGLLSWLAWEALRSAAVVLAPPGAERVALQQHSTWRQPDCALRESAALIHGVHHAEAVEDHVGITVIRSALMYVRVSCADQPTTNRVRGRDEGCMN
jgi:hypothetical protein